MGENAQIATQDKKLTKPETVARKPLKQLNFEKRQYQNMPLCVISPFAAQHSNRPDRSVYKLLNVWC